MQTLVRLGCILYCQFLPHLLLQMLILCMGRVSYCSRHHHMLSLPLLSTALVVTTSGSVVSCTVIVKDSSEGLPAASYALHVTTVSPIGNVSPRL